MNYPDNEKLWAVLSAEFIEAMTRLPKPVKVVKVKTKGKKK